MRTKIQSQENTQHCRARRVCPPVAHPLEHGAPTIEAASSPKTGSFQLGRANLFWPKGNVTHAAFSVEPPGVRHQSTLLPQPAIKWCAREWHEVVERRQKELLIASKRHAFLHNAPV